MVRVKRWGKSPPGGVATHRAVRLMGCKVMYTGAVGLLVRCRGVNRAELYGDINAKINDRHLGNEAHNPAYRLTVFIRTKGELHI